MELAFETKPLRSLCESEAQAKRELGSRVADSLKHRLADLRAATSVQDLVSGRPRELENPNSEHFCIDLCDGYRIVLCANHTKNPRTDAGKLAWSRVGRIKILRIESEDDQPPRV